MTRCLPYRHCSTRDRYQTQLRGRDGEIRNVPNSVFASKTTVNFSRAMTQRLEVRSRARRVWIDRGGTVRTHFGTVLARSQRACGSIRACAFGVSAHRCAALSRAFSPPRDLRGVRPSLAARPMTPDLPPGTLETKISLQLEDLPKATAVIDTLRNRLSNLRDTVVDGSRNFWIHLGDITSQSAQARRFKNMEPEWSFSRPARCAFLLMSSFSFFCDELSLTRALLRRTQIEIEVHYAGSDDRAFREWRVF